MDKNHKILNWRAFFGWMPKCLFFDVHTTWITNLVSPGFYKKISCLLGPTLLILLGSGCSSEDKRQSAEELAKIHCSSCHIFPDPSLLDKQTWQEKVMPHMALRLGISPPFKGRQDIQDAYFYLTEHNLFSEKPVISNEQWTTIKNYFSTHAPQVLDQPTHKLDSLDYFKIINNPKISVKSIPAVTDISFDPHNRKFLVASFGRQKIDFVGNQQEAPAINSGPKIISDIQSLGRTASQTSKYLITYLGRVIRPDAAAEGLLAEVTVNDGTIINLDPLQLPPLHRPVQAIYTELDGEPGDELLVCEFGYLTGKLSYFKKDGDGVYRQTILLNEPGAIKVESDDFTGDGLNDIMVLMAHGNERISLLVNLGNGRFEERVLLQFPPVYGSTGFELADLNNDQLLDIIYTCGDNADISGINKPYHGVYLYLNKGNFKFEQIYHYQMPGAYDAVARDFDLDGDIDIAAIAFFVNPELPHGFVLLEQQENFRFKSLSNAVNAVGRLIDIEAADIDGDGDQDIIVGNGFGLTGLDMIDKNSRVGGPSWILMENQQKMPEIIPVKTHSYVE